MKKIFIPVLMLIVIGLSAPSYGRWGERFSHGNHRGDNSLFSSDSDGYWLNRFRGYKKYPVNFYSESMINKGSGEEVQEIEAHEYKRGVPVTARLGQRMYDSTTYTVTTKRGGEQYKAVSDGVLYNMQNEIKIKKGQIFKPFGEIKVNGQYYLLFELPETSYIAAVDQNGQFLDALGLIENEYLYITKDITVVRPHDLKVEPYDDVEESSSDAELRFEIKYGGIQGDEMSFVVSEGKDNEYDQRQFVPLAEKTVQINGVNFEIIHASPDYIEYEILESQVPENQTSED